MKLGVKRATLDELIAAYADAAGEHGRLSSVGDDKKANPRVEEVAAIYRELRDRGADAQRALLPLLRHLDVHVRAWVAAHALEFAPEAGEPVLEELATSSQIVGLNAAMTLREWRQGTLRFP